MLASFENQLPKTYVKRVIVIVRVVLCTVLLWGVAWSSAKAQTDAAWIGTAGDGSYDNGANWSVGVVPVNDAVPTTYNVTIPGSVSVTYDVDGSNDVTDLTLGVGSTLTIAPGEQLNVLDDARISGTITTTAGTFNALAPGAQFQNNSALLSVAGGGEIAIAALDYTNVKLDYRANLTFLSAQGLNSSLDLSSVQNFSAAGSWGNHGQFYYDVVASDHGVVNLSSVGTITGATNDDWLRFRIETDGDIPLTSLTQTSGRTQFIIDVDNYSLPALQTMTDTHLSIDVGRTVSASALTSISGSVGGVVLSDGATLNVPELLSIDGKAITIGTGGTIAAAKLATLTNASMTLGANQTFTHGTITNVDHSELQVADGALLTLDGVGGYTNTLSDVRTNVTLLSAQGLGSSLDLSSAQSFNAAGSWGNYGQFYYDVVASDHGVVNLSSVGTITGATNDDWLRFRIETDGDIPLTSLTQTSARTMFVIDADNYSFPALVTAADTHFSIGAGRAVSAPELIVVSGSAGGIAVSDGGSFTAAKLTTISGLGGSLTVGDGATLGTPELLSIDGKSISIAAGGTITASKLTSLTNVAMTLGANQTFTHGVIEDVNYSELHARDGVTLDLTGVGGYTNFLNNYRAHLTLLSAQGQDSLLDMSSAQSFSVAGSWSQYETYYYDVAASDNGVVDLSSVGTIVGAANTEWLRFRIETEGNIPLTSLTQTSARTMFDIDVDNYSFPVLETAADTHFAIGAGRAVSAPELIVVSGSAGGIGISDGGSFTAAKLTTISGLGGSLTVGDGATLGTPELLSIDGKSISIAAGGTITASKLTSLTNVAMTLGANQTFTHGVIEDVNYSELHARDGVTLDLTGVGGYTNFLNNYRAHLTLLSAQGQASLLDMSSAQSFSVAGSWSQYETYYYDVAASDNGVVDLSSVGTIVGAANTEWLRFRIETEGNIPLTSLTQTSARTMFDIDVDNYSFPVLETAADTHFAIGAGRAVSAPELIVVSGSAGGIGISDGGSFTAAKLTTISGLGGSLTVGDGATLGTPELLSIDGKSISIAAGGTITASKLTSLTNVAMTLGANQTFTHGVIEDVNYSELHARDGVTLDLTGVGGYTNFLNNYRAHLTLLSAQGQASLLDMSSAQSFSVAGSWSQYETYYYDVAASDNGVVDLSSVGTIVGAANTEWLRFRVDTGGTIDLSSLRSIADRTVFEVNGDGVLKLGDVALTETTYFNVNSPETDVDIAGSLYLDGASQLSMVTGSELQIQGAFYYAYTDPAKLGTDSAILHFNGSGIQFLEAGGEDLGVTGSASGNFGIGRLVVGELGQPTTVLPLDLFDNGNRTGEAPEALYLYGVGGLNGLELIDGSTLVLDGINVYAWQDEAWVHLNALIAEGEAEAAFSGGTIMVPEPSGLILLVAAATALLLLGRFRISSR